MLTLYEVKQNTCFRVCYKRNAVIRNCFLMMILVILLIPMYVIFFHPGDQSYESMKKVLKGLNSSTFNYLENNKESLRVDKPMYTIMNEGEPEPTSMMFFSGCVRINRPCLFRGLAKNWAATKKWSERNGGEEYLKEKMGNKTVTAYRTARPDNEDHNEYEKYSFPLFLS
jgi:hypothetical protein